MVTPLGFRRLYRASSLSVQMLYDTRNSGTCQGGGRGGRRGPTDVRLRGSWLVQILGGAFAAPSGPQLSIPSYFVGASHGMQPHQQSPSRLCGNSLGPTAHPEPRQYATPGL